MRRVLLTHVCSATIALMAAASAQAQGGAAVPPAERYHSYNALIAAAREGAAATGAAGVTSTTGAETGAVTSADDEVVVPSGRTVSGTLPGNISADQALGQDVYGPNGENVAEIEDVLIDDGGSIAAVILDVGGLLGLGERQVAVRADQLRTVADAEGAATGGAGEGGGAAAISGAAGVGAGTGAGAGDANAAGDAGPGGDRPQLALTASEDELRQLPAWRREGALWVRQAAGQR